MKVGDKVYHKDLAGIATITKVAIQQSKDKNGKTVVKTTYFAKYPNGATITFFGFDIGKKIIQYVPFEQMSFLNSID